MRAPVIDLFVNILTKRSLTSKNDVKAILNLLCDCGPDLAPEPFGNWEPLKKQFNPLNIEEALDSWKDRFLLNRRSAVRGSLCMGRKTRHGALLISADSRSFGITPTIIFQEASVQLKADFGFIHLLSDPDIERGMLTYTVGTLNKKPTKFVLSVFTHDLFKYLPDPCWCTRFRPPYMSHFGRHRKYFRLRHV